MNRKSNQVSLEPYGYRVVQPAVAKKPVVAANPIPEIKEKPIATVTPAAMADTLQQAIQPKAGNNRGCVAAVVGILLFMLVIGIVASGGRPLGAGGSSYSAGNAIRYEPSPKLHKVVYKVSVLQDGCHFIGTTYEMPSGTAQKEVAACSDSTTVTVDSRTAEVGDFLYLSVQNDNKVTTITCQIFVDGKLTYQTKSTGQYVIASCSGSL